MNGAQKIRRLLAADALQPFPRGWPVALKPFAPPPYSPFMAKLWENPMAVRKRKSTRKSPVKRRRSPTRKKAAPKRKAKPLSSAVRASLAKKAKSSGYSLGTLTKVYRRGQGAFLSSGSRPGMTMSRWAHARVNSFIRGSKKHDTDLRRKRK